MKLELATQNDFDAIIAFYDDVTKNTSSIERYARWSKGKHPTVEGIKAYIDEESMYQYRENDAIVGTMAITMYQGEDYHAIDWTHQVADDKVAVIHILAVSPDAQGKGFGSEMIREAIRLAHDNGMQAIRLDALASNTPAHKLYERLGFEYRGKQHLYAENTGWTDFYFFEFKSDICLTEKIMIRDAKETDAKAIQAIYAPYVEQTAVTFEYNVPSEEEFSRRIESVKQKYPWIVAERNGQMVGYAYASAFKPRDAYQWAVETSIYVNQSLKRCGIGRQLHEALEQRLKAQGILNMNACISFIDPEDEYLTQDSVRFHERLGYQKVAHFHQCGKKFNRWYDMIWMEKLIGEHL